MKHLLLASLVLLSLSLSSCLGHRSSGSKTSAASAGDPGSGTGGGFRSIPGGVNAPPGGSGSGNGNGTSDGLDFANLPNGITLVPSLADQEVASLYACGNYIYAVTKYTVSTKVGIHDKLILHRLKVSHRDDNTFEDISLKKSGSQEASYLLDGLTCVENSYLAGTYRFATENAWSEHLFIYDPGTKTIPYYRTIYSSGAGAHPEAWLTSTLRLWRNINSGTTYDMVRNNLIKVNKFGSNIVLSIIKEDKNLDRFILKNGSPSDVTIRQNVSIQEKLGDFHDASMAVGPGSNGYLVAQMERGKSTGLRLLKYAYDGKQGEKIEIMNFYQIPNDSVVNASLVRWNGATYLFYYGTTNKDQNIRKIYKLPANLADNGNAFDEAEGAGNVVKFTYSPNTFIRKHGKAIVERVVYADEEKYIFLNADDQLSTFYPGEYLTLDTIDASRFSSLNLPKRYEYLLNYADLKKIVTKFAKFNDYTNGEMYAEDAAIVAGGLDRDDVYISFPYEGKGVTFRGRLEDFANWAATL